MMGRQDGQMAMVFVDMESLIPETHLLRKIDKIISFEFIYDLLAPYYPSVGRPSVDPVCMFKMLLVGYLYGIKSERRLEEEVWFNKRGIGYLMESTVDYKHGIVTGVDVYSANEKESIQVLRHLERQIKLGVPMKNIALDRGYETGAVHRGLELLGITGYIPAIRFSNPPEKYGFTYVPERDVFICPKGMPLTYHRLNCNKSTGKYLRCYQTEGNTCIHCPKRPTCFHKAGIRRRILASSCYPAFYRGHQRVGTPEFYSMMRLRKIWAEGSFAVLKREHCISKIRKRGIPAAAEECLLAVMALNLKRMVRAIFYKLKIQFIWAEGLFPRPSFPFCQQVRNSKENVHEKRRVSKRGFPFFCEQFYIYGSLFGNKMGMLTTS